MHLAKADRIVMYMNEQDCAIGPDTYSGRAAYFRLDSSSIPVLSAESRDQKSPISATLSYAQGTATYSYDDPTDGTHHWDKFVITDTVTEQFRAGKIDVYFADTQNAPLEFNVCATELSYQPEGPVSLRTGHFPEFVARGLSRVEARQALTATTDISFIYLTNVQWRSHTYTNLQISIKTAAQAQSSLYVYASGTNLVHDLPYLKNDDTEEFRALTSAYVSKLLVAKPEGRLALQYESERPLVPSLGAADFRYLEMGARNDFFGMNLARFAGLQAAFEIFRPDWSRQASATGLEIDGSTYSARYADTELVKSGWQALAPEVQAVLLSIPIGIAAWLIKRTITREADSNQEQENRVTPLPKPTPSVGSTALVLSSGRIIAGTLRKRPTFLHRYYVLECTVSKFGDHDWHTENSGPVRIEADRVEYAYIVDAYNLGDEVELR